MFSKWLIAILLSKEVKKNRESWTPVHVTFGIYPTNDVISLSSFGQGKGAEFWHAESRLLSIWFAAPERLISI